MNRSELTQGMLIETRRNEFGLVIDSKCDRGLIVVGGGNGENHTWGDVDGWESDLTTLWGDAENDIIRVWSVSKARMNWASFDTDSRDLLWERKDYTMGITNEYRAIIKEDGIHVGCQIITFDKFDSLVALVDKFKNKQ